MTVANSHTDRPDRLAFGVFELDLRRRELRRQGARVHLQDKPYELLVALIERAGDEVSRAELRERLWPEGAFVDFEAGINTAVAKLREALGDDAEAARFIETHARHGYRFVAPVNAAASHAGASPLAPAPPPALPAAPGSAAVPATATPDSTRRLPRRRWFLAAAAVALLALAGFGLREWRRPAQPIRSLAVLPLADHSKDPTFYFADGMTEALITQLAKLGSLRVISRTSISGYKDSRKRLPDIARELGVDAIVEGAIVRAGERFRLDVQLIDGRTDSHLWAESYERSLAEVPALQTELARTIAGEVAIELTPGEAARLGPSRRVDPRAQEAYLRGRYFWNLRTADGFRRALQEFTAATAINPQYAEAYAGLADTYGLMAISGYDLLPPGEAMPKAREAARRALALDESLAEAHASIGWVSYAYDWEFPAAEREFRRAIELRPGYATAHQWYSNYLCAMGRLDEATEEIGRALALDPLSRVILNEAAWPHYYGRRHRLEIAAYRKVLAMAPDYPTPHLELGIAFDVSGRYQEALAEYATFSRLTGGSSTALAYTVHAEGKQGNRERASALLAQLEQSASQGYVPPYDMAVANAGLGDWDAFFAWLEKAYAERSDALLYLAVDPMFAELHDDPRFTALVRRIGLPAPVAQRPASSRPSL